VHVAGNATRKATLPGNCEAAATAMRSFGRSASPDGSVPAPLYIAGMRGRGTYKLTWEEIVALYQLTLDRPAINTRARFNVCPTSSRATRHSLSR
jgi:hypothetical protein